MNGLTYNNLDCECYDIIDSNGVSYQLILSVYDAERPKFVSHIRRVDPYTILYWDEIDCN